jgi:hypothetical protein
MKTEVEVMELIATRVPPSDRWRLTRDGSEGPIHNSLTDALEAYFTATGFKGAYRLEPLESKLFAIRVEDAPVEEPKEYSFYGDFKQGI